jgi:hypothetical protein
LVNRLTRQRKINVMTKKDAIIVLLILIVALFQVTKHRDRLDALEKRVMALETQWKEVTP